MPAIMVVHLDKTLKYRVGSGFSEEGFRGVRGELCTKIAITQYFFMFYTFYVSFTIFSKFGKNEDSNFCAGY